MTAASRRWAADILHVWFHRLGPNDWFGASGRVDAMLERRYRDTLAALAARPPHEFLGDPNTARAAILLFDQIPRNIYRASARAFSCDAAARAIAQGVIARGWHGALSRTQNQFVGMPLMHSEHIADQLASLAFFRRHAPGSASFARAHYAMIARFGRFPHRNAVLGRATSAAERRAIERGFAW